MYLFLEERKTAEIDGRNAEANQFVIFFQRNDKTSLFISRPWSLVEGDGISAFKRRGFFHSDDIVSVISCVLLAWMLSLLGYLNQLCRENRSF